VVPEVLNSDEILVESQVVNLIHIGQGDVEGFDDLHVPSADAVVCGDVVYNNVHMMMFEADEAKRETWIASIDEVATLNAKTVVAGHNGVGAADIPGNLAASQRTCATSPPLAKKGGTVENLVHGMLELHGDRDQPHPYGSRLDRSRATDTNRSAIA
jgi:glyoxylase-like metal-dependent hydrolase (beta-lactamase superfamily II)